jgi:hypothetical protein
MRKLRLGRPVRRTPDKDHRWSMVAGQRQQWCCC